MKFSKKNLLDALGSIDYISKPRNIEIQDFELTFDITFFFEELEKPIEFEVIIYSSYPFKINGSETIKFKNINLIKYSHVMSDGSVCFHNQHCTDFNKKLTLDFDAIRDWIIKYIVNEEKDTNYEHLIVDYSVFNDYYYSYQFTEVKGGFEKGEFGTVNLFLLSKTPYYQSYIKNFLVQSFNDSTKLSQKECSWSSSYLDMEQSEQGLYLFIEKAPAIHERFSFNNWTQFESLIEQNFLQYLSRYVIEIKSKHDNNKPLPIFIGFNTIEDEIHWQVALINVDETIFKGLIDPVGKITYTLKNKTINWAITENSSYPYFFGRGKFCEKLTKSNILIIGIGAIGSNVAKTLVRCGCRYLSLVDHDIKKPENICRSEFEFTNTYINKVDELFLILRSISPFVEVKTGKGLLTEQIKSKAYFELLSENIENELSSFDYIFDCTTDDDLMYILDNLNITANIINLSITNHAKSLVCGVSPNTYKFVRHQFENILENDVEDLYNPIGCWSPTFKASYNDITTLIQFALKHINIMISNEQLNSFVIDHDNNYESLRVSKF